MSDVQLSTSSRSRQRSHYQQVESHDHLSRSHNPHVTRSHDKSRDPFLPPDPKAQSYPGVRGSTKEHPTASNKSWDTFTDDQRRFTSTFYPLSKSHDTPSQVDPRIESHTLRRYGSQGAFSDDFVGPRLSRESSNRSIPNLPQAVQRVSSASRLRMSTEALHSRATGGTSESDLSQVAEIQYQRLMASPNAQSSDERSPTLRRSEMGRWAQRAAVTTNADVIHSARVNKGREIGNQRAEYGDLTPDMPRSKVARSFSYRVAQRNGRMEFESPLSLRRCFSDEKTSSPHHDSAVESMESKIAARGRGNVEERLGAFGMEILQQISAFGGTHSDQPASQLHSASIHDNKNGASTRDHPIVAAESASSSTGPDGILMSSGTAGKATTDTQTTGTSLELTNHSQSGQATNDQAGVEQMDTQSARETNEDLSEMNSGGLLSPLFATNSSTSQPLATNKEFWSNLLADFGSEEGNGRAEGGATKLETSKPGFYLFSLEESSLPKLENKQNTTFQQSETGPLLSPISHQSQDLDIFPQALSSESNLLQEDDEPTPMCPNSMSQIPLLAAEDEELTPQEDEQQLLPKLDVQNGTNVDVTSWLREVSRVTNQASISDHVSNHMTTSAPSSNVITPPINSQSVAAVAPLYAGNIRGYDIMSPIPEASQELTSSMSQPNTNRDGAVPDSRLRSVSPISEVRSTSPSARQTSVSPFRHSALSASDHTSTQHSQSTSERGSTAQSSSVVTALQNASTRPGQTSSESATNLSELRAATPKQDTQSDISSQSNPQRDHVSISSGSGDVSQTSSARAQVNVDVSSAVRTLMNTQSPDTNRDTQTASRDQLQSSSESGEHQQRNRAGTPQSSSSAPACIQHSAGVRREARALSPLATSNLSASTVLVSQKPQSTSQGGRESGASRMRYSQQRASEYPRHQPRINQDLEMMNLAISGMDSQERSRQSSSSLNRSQTGSSHNRSQTTLASSSQNRNQGITSTSQNRNQSMTSTSQNRNQGITSTSQNRNQGMTSTSQNRNQPSGDRHSRPEIDPSRSFRPITPVLAGNFRSSSAPGGRDHEIQTSHTANGQLSGTGPQLGGNASAQQSLQEQTNTSTDVPLPPQVSVDSYDYLPPYSPPSGRGVSTHQPTRDQTQFSEPQSYPEPPPSYDEIFGGGRRGGRRRRNRASNLRRSQTSGEQSIQSPDGSRPASQSSESRLFSRNSSNQRRLPSLSRLFKRSRRHSHTGASEHINSSSQQTNEATPMDITEYTASWVESYSHTPRPAEVLSTMSTGGVSNTHSQASRALSDTTTTRSSPSARRELPVPYRHPPPFQGESIPQSSMSDVGGRSYPPPRRNISQSRGSLNASLSHIPTADTASSVSRFIHTSSDQPGSGTGQHTGHARLNVIRRGLSRDRPNDRPRPSSAYITTETSRAVANVDTSATYNRTSSRTSHGSTHSTPRQGARLLINTGPMSSSCFNILSHSEDHEHSRPHSATERRTEQSAADKQGDSITPLGSTSSIQRQGRNVSSSQQGNDIVQAGLSEGGSRGNIPSPRGDENSSQNDPNLVANANANNINTNPVASPQASCTISPIIFNAATGEASNSQAFTPPMSSNSITNLSTDTIVANVASLPTNTKSSTASSPTNGTLRAENNSSSNLSNRAAARLRAESRRSQQDNRESSSDEENGGSQRSDLSFGLSSGSSSRGRVRPRRRRSQQSSSGYSRANSIQGDVSTRMNTQSDALRLISPPEVQSAQLPQIGRQNGNDRQVRAVERNAESTETRVLNLPTTEGQNTECIVEENEGERSQHQTMSAEEGGDQRETQSVTGRY